MPISEEELLELITKLSNGEGDDKEAQEWLAKINANVPYPDVAELIFYRKPELTPDQILEEALSYKPIQL